MSYLLRKVGVLMRGGNPSRVGRAPRSLASPRQERCDLPAKRLRAWSAGSVHVVDAARSINVMTEQLPGCRVTRRGAVDLLQPAFNHRIRLVHAYRRLHQHRRRRCPAERRPAYVARVRHTATVCYNNTHHLHQLSLFNQSRPKKKYIHPV